MIPPQMEQFKKQNEDEFSSRFNALVKSEAEVSLWQKGGVKFHVRAEHFDDKSLGLRLLIDLEGKAPPVAGEYLIHFIIRKVAYFAKGSLKISKQNVFNVAELYRHEKRKDERLLTYPHHKCLVLIPVKEKEVKEDTNILFLQKKQSVKVGAADKFNDYAQKKDEKLIGNLVYRSFRVLDLSSGGLSFYANSSEKEFLHNNKNFTKIIIELNGERYAISKAETLYGVDYLDPRATHVPMFKMGFKFSAENEILNKVIAKTLGALEKSDDLAKMFEDSF